MDEDGVFDKSEQADRIAMLAVYMPLIRYEAQEFQKQWNTHTIRNQRKHSPNSVHGKPWMLYRHSDAMEYAIRPNTRWATSFLDELEQYDPSEYLPATTFAWCHRTAFDLGFNLDTLSLADAFPDGARVHCEAYLQLQEALQYHIQENLEPELFETAIPYGAAQWNPDDLRQAHGRNTSRNVDLSTCVNPLIEAEFMKMQI